MNQHLVHHSLIIVAKNRQRRTFDEAKHQELIESIKGAAGLLQCPVVRWEGDVLTLVAGERRLRALREIWDFGGKVSYGGMELPEGMVPIVNLGDLDPLAAREAELEENIKRDDLTWQDRARAEAELFALRRDRGVPAPIMQIAEEVGVSAPILARNLVLAGNLHRPEVAQAKTAKEAFRALERVETQERNAELAGAMGKEFLGAQHKVLNLDCLGWLTAQPSSQFDVILTDPPYGMGADEFGDSGGKAGGAHFYHDTPDQAQFLIGEALPQLFRLAKADAHLYLFCDIDQFNWLKVEAHKVGWRPFRTPLIWFKPSAFRAPWPEQGPQRKYECILYAVKGGLKCTALAGDVIPCPPDENLGHQAQKPVALFTELLRRSVRPGMRVLDPFCGTGPIFPAAHSLGAIATGVEMDAAAYGIAVKRVQQLKG